MSTSMFFAKNRTFPFPLKHHWDNCSRNSTFITTICLMVTPRSISRSNPIPDGDAEAKLLTTTKNLLWRNANLNQIGVDLMMTRGEPQKLEASVYGLLLDEIMSEFKGKITMKVTLPIQDKENKQLLTKLESEKGITRGLWRFQTILSSEAIKKLQSDNELIGTLSLELIPEDDEEKDFLNATASYKRMLEEKIHWNFEIKAKTGEVIKCHKAILALHIPFFTAIFQDEDGNPIETEESSISLNLSAEGVNALLKFIYYSNVDDMRTNQKVAVELLEFANNYGMTELTKFLKNLFMTRIETWDVDLALTLFSGANRDDELESKAFQIIKTKPYEQLSNSPAYKKIFMTKPGKAMKLFRYFHESNN